MMLIKSLSLFLILGSAPLGHASFQLTQAPQCSGAFELIGDSYNRMKTFTNGEEDEHDGECDGKCTWRNMVHLKLGGK